ncbi:putative quinol monooxygenase [Actinacidiphila bryophytorum]|uniref:Quinol monooxygenase YgiN n=1 Tax=Actinacidiphila bryophytorum TaxID=1436133 RepID=A0A9W4MAV9_9ACTN|nr:antibiotic biosynthesis monooxygenase [Actinacidiphila bryophytorum]MBM9440593.1 antibiotic biosynthesis monooxygenase [Actinacidiphila bryophytorum]MBN6543176.1 antibiotic biosynthesis monooxygenase [Actinacidiphila bryophytorum]CAG7645252.1 Quinol monooxygenase YgiN [Actinacidiphila bryophytorum]
MVTLGILIRFEAKPDKVAAVESMLRSALQQVRGDASTVAWHALRLGPTSFAVFDAFEDEAGRQAHWDAYSRPLEDAAPDLFTAPPTVDFVDILGAKLPGA